MAAFGMAAIVLATGTTPIAAAGAIPSEVIASALDAYGRTEFVTILPLSSSAVT